MREIETEKGILRPGESERERERLRKIETEKGRRRSEIDRER